MRESQGFRPDVKTVIIVLTGGDTEDIELAVSESAAIVATGVSGARHPPQFIESI